MIKIKDETYLTYEEAATYLHTTKSSLYGMTARGKTSPKRIGPSQTKYFALSELKPLLPEEFRDEEVTKAVEVVKPQQPSSYEQVRSLLDSINATYSKLAEDNRKLAEDYIRAVTPIAVGLTPSEMTSPQVAILSAFAQVLANVWKIIHTPGIETQQPEHILNMIMEGIDLDTSEKQELTTIFQQLIQEKNNQHTQVA